MAQRTGAEGPMRGLAKTIAMFGAGDLLVVLIAWIGPAPARVVYEPTGP